MGRKECGVKEMMIPLLGCRQGNDWKEESSALLLKINSMQLFGWERNSSRLLRTRRSKGIIKKLGSVYLAPRNAISKRDVHLSKSQRKL